MRTALLATALLLSAGAAQAALTVSGSVGGAPTGVDRENFDSLPLGSGGGTLANGLSVSFTGNAQTVTGSVSGRYAAPFLSGDNGLGFGPGGTDQPNGRNATPYLTAGSFGSLAGSAVTLTFDTPQRYLGLLWGSIDRFNQLEFFSGASSIGLVTGTDVLASPNGNQGVDGTLYVNINSVTSFDRVVARSSTFAFEFDNLAFNETRVPAPAAIALFGLGLAAMGLRRRG